MMATTARRLDPEDDIAAIAKQISDQAEAIYQNWKARGLGPADLITCHAATDAAKIGSMLKPQPPAKPASVELLAQAPAMDNQRLQTLVTNFVSEDKARLAARQTQPAKPMPSSILHALQKFERHADAHDAATKIDEPNYVRKSPLKTTYSVGKTVVDHAQKSPVQKPAIGQKPQISPKPRIGADGAGDAAVAPVLQSWPLKNRVITTDGVRARHGADADRPAPTTIDDVAVEEKRLLQALKNGVVVNEASKRVAPIVTKWDLRSTRRADQSSVPHPELTSSQRQHLRQTAANPVRPFLTRGSVAERVLIFERCPSDLLLDKRARAPAPAVGKIQTSHKPAAAPIAHTTLQRHVRANRHVHIPKFHFPSGRPAAPGQLDAARQRVATAFQLIGERASRDDFAALARACHVPLYWKTPLYFAVCGERGTCTLVEFMAFWTTMCNQCHDASSRFVHILTRGKRQLLAPEDFIPMVQDVVETHPGLTFLKEATEFHSRYVHTVIARIYYNVNRSWSGQITIPELRRSNLLQIIQTLEEEEDINQVTQYFSYEHFYVIYCKFWELDRDHDLFIDKDDLTRHNDHALSTRIIDRIFSGCVTRGGQRRRQGHDEDKMSYTEFVWFLLSEEDKRHPTAVEYWFRCMDLDGDGVLSMYELEHFYDEQAQRMEAIGIETLPFKDCLCQMLDMVKPKFPGKITLSDLKRCKMTPIFFDTFFNLEKYLDHEQRDPFASQRDHDFDGQEMSDWDRYAAEEYELLVAEEGGNEQNDSLSFDECVEDDLSPNMDEDKIDLYGQDMDLITCDLSDDSDASI